MWLSCYNPTMMKTKLLVLSLILLANLGCFWLLPIPDRDLNEYVSEEDVVGVWSLSHDSLDLLVRDGFRSDETHQYEIEFLSNGEVVFRSVVSYFGRGTYYEMEGKWKLEHDTTGNSNGEKKNVIRMEFNHSDGPRGLYLNFDKQGEDLVLWEFYSDPDLQDFMEYTKVE